MAKREKYRLNHVGTKLDAELKEYMELVEKRN